MWKRSALILPALVLSLCVWPPYAGAKPKPVRVGHYLQPDQFQFPQFQAPPVSGSNSDKADMAVVREWQNKRTEDQCAQAQAEARAEYDEFFGSMSPFPRPLPPGAAVVLRRVKSEVDAAASKLKDRYMRLRPFNIDSSIVPCISGVGGWSYPSGHAAIARIYALLLSDLEPERRLEFIVRADEAALNRVIGGVHYPSDIEAGKKMADILYPMYLKSPVFISDLETLRGYLMRVPAGAPR
jgi:acid phosphatase (class A)